MKLNFNSINEVLMFADDVRAIRMGIQTPGIQAPDPPVDPSESDPQPDVAALDWVCGFMGELSPSDCMQIKLHPGESVMCIDDTGDPILWSNLRSATAPVEYGIAGPTKVYCVNGSPELIEGGKTSVDI